MTCKGGNAHTEHNYYDSGNEVYTDSPQPVRGVEPHEGLRVTSTTKL